MNILYKVLTIATLFCSSILPIEQLLTSENTILCFDYDDVVIEKSPWFKPKMITKGIYQRPFNTINYISALLNLKNAHKKDPQSKKNSFFDQQNNPISGLTFQFLYQGKRDPLFTPYVSWMTETTENLRCFIDGTKNIMEYLKTKNYEMVIATNKDRVSYDLSAQVFGNEINTLVTKVFVAHPGNHESTLQELQEFAQLPTTDISYKILEEQARTVQPTETIFHVPSTKPNKAYFSYLEANLDTDKQKIFIDDKLANVKAAQSMGMHGIHFKNPLQLAEELIKLGILSEIYDKEFLDKMRQK